MLLSVHVLRNMSDAYGYPTLQVKRPYTSEIPAVVHQNSSLIESPAHSARKKRKLKEKNKRLREKNSKPHMPMVVVTFHNVAHTAERLSHVITQQ